MAMVSVVSYGLDKEKNNLNFNFELQTNDKTNIYLK